MKQYLAGKIRNVAIVGHESCGKTSLAEALLLKTQTIDKLGKITQGNTVCDFDKQEIKRFVSIKTAIAPIVWGSVKINLIDTAGLFDFSGGFYESMSACDSVLIVVSALFGVLAGTERAYENANKQGKGKMFFVNKIDSKDADFYNVLAQLKTNFGPSICPLVVPVFENGKLLCFVNLVHEQAYKYDENGKYKSVKMPDMGHRLAGLRASMYEAIAQTSDILFDKYFSGAKLTRTEILTGIHEGVRKGTISPVLCGSAIEMQGITPLLDAISDHLPSAWENGDRIAKTEILGDVLVKCTDEDPLAVQIFKTEIINEQTTQSFVKVVSGKLEENSSALNIRTGEKEEISKLYYVIGKQLIQTPVLYAGDIGAVLNLKDTLTGDTLCDFKNKVEFRHIKYPKPTYLRSIRFLNDKEHSINCIKKMLLEDLCINFEYNTETQQYTLAGLGDKHLDVFKMKLKDIFSLEIILEKPKIAYHNATRNTDGANIILKPIGLFKGYVPSDNEKSLILELEKRRGVITSISKFENNTKEIVAEVPMDEMLDFTLKMREISHDRGEFSISFTRFEELL